MILLISLISKTNLIDANLISLSFYNIYNYDGYMGSLPRGDYPRLGLGSGILQNDAIWVLDDTDENHDSITEFLKNHEIAKNCLILIDCHRKHTIRNFIFFKIDINKNCSKLIKLIKRFRIKFILNFSSQGMVEESFLTPTQWYNTNITSSVKFIGLQYGRTYVSRCKFLEQVPP